MKDLKNNTTAELIQYISVEEIVDVIYSNLDHQKGIQKNNTEVNSVDYISGSIAALEQLLDSVQRRADSNKELDEFINPKK